MKKLLHFKNYVFFLSFLFFFIGCSNDEMIGNKALEIGDFKRAEKFFSKILDSDPTHRNARYGAALAKYGIAEEAERNGILSIRLWKKAADEFRILSKIDSSVSIHPVYSNCLFYLARAILLETPEADVSLLIQKSIALDSTNYFSFNLKALIAENRGQFKEAETTFIYILSKFPDFKDGYINFGNFYWNKGEIGDAWDIWSMGEAKFPKDKQLKDLKNLAENALSKDLKKIGENSLAP